MQIVIKKAEAADAKVLAEILTQAMRFKLARDDNVWGTRPYTASELQKRIDQGSMCSAWLDNRLVATVTLLWDDEMVWGKQPPVAAYIHQLAVKDGYHGVGIGEKVLDWAANHAADKGRAFLRLDVPPFNKGLRTYYEKLGFRWVRDQKVHAPHADYTAALYERPVR